MGFFQFVKTPDINRGIADCRNTEGAVLLDVRTPQEYREGHIPGSINIPLQQLDKAIDAYENKDVPLFVYCHSGARSRQAAAFWKATVLPPITFPVASASTMRWSMTVR